MTPGRQGSPTRGRHVARSAITTIAVVSAAGIPLGCDGNTSTDTVDRLELRLIDRFGSVDGPLALGTIRRMTLHPDGQVLYIVQQGSASVLSLSQSGDSVGSIGRPGDGPGELRLPGRPHVLRDTVWVADGDRSISRFTPEGAYLDDIRPDVEPEARLVFQGPFDNGALFYQGSVLAHFDLDSVPLVSLDRSGARITRLGARGVAGAFYASTQGGPLVSGQHPAPLWDLTAIDPLGRWVVVAEQEPGDRQGMGFDLVWLSPDGDTIRSVHVDTPPVGIDGLRSRWERDFATGMGLPIGWVERLSEQDLAWPGNEPSIDALFSDLSDRVWVRTPHVAPDSSVWRVIRVDGTELGAITLPSRVRLEAAKGSEVWGWAPGEYDVVSVLRFRLAGPA